MDTAAPVTEFGTNFAQYSLMLSYGLLAFAVAAVLIMWVVNGLKDPKKFLFSILFLVGFAAIFGIAYASSSSFTNDTVTKFKISPEATRVVGAAMKMMYLLIGAALIGIVVNTVTGIIKRI